MFRTHLKNLVRLSHMVFMRTMCFGKRTIPITATTLIIAPHPDDEVIGCGGLISRLISNGITPHIVIMTGGEKSHVDCCKLNDEEIKSARHQLTRNALHILGISTDHIHELNFHDGEISPNNLNKVAELRQLINKLRPKNILIPHWGEGWPDHINTAQIIKQMKLANCLIWEYCVWVWYYNIWRRLDWKNATVLKMSKKEQRLKIKAMKAYTEPLAPCGRPWSGTLPHTFLRANQWNKELYFRVK